MLSTGEVNTVGLFTFIAILDVGLLTIAYMQRKWFFLDLIVLAGTVMWWAAWDIGISEQVGWGVDYDPIRIMAVFFVWLFISGSMIWEALLLKQGEEKFQAIDRIVAALSLIASWPVLFWTTSSSIHWQDEVNGLIFVGLNVFLGLFYIKQGWSTLASQFRLGYAVFIAFMVPYIWHDAEIAGLAWAVIGIATVVGFAFSATSIPGMDRIWITYTWRDGSHREH